MGGFFVRIQSNIVDMANKSTKVFYGPMRCECVRRPGVYSAILTLVALEMKFPFGTHFALVVCTCSVIDYWPRFAAEDEIDLACVN